MATPRTKRQFAGAASDSAQRQITSFFGKAPNSGARDTPAPSILSSPPLPGSVQANLLNVGMRVRKSVPEGYKTGSLYGSFSLWADGDEPIGKPAAPSAAPRSAPPPPSYGRELLPFCGIHKVGGLAPQPEAPGDRSPPATARGVPALGDVPDLTSSQESADSDASPSTDAPATRKRVFSEAEAAAGYAGRDDHVSSDWENSRTLAVPRRRGGDNEAAFSATAGMKSGVMLGARGNMAADDFEEADFLDPQLAPSMDLE